MRISDWSSDVCSSDLGNAALAQGDGFQRDLAALSGSGGQAQAPGAVPAEEHRLAVLQHDLAVGGDAAPGEALEDAVVVHDAVLEDLDQRGAAMLTRALQHFRQVLLLGVDRARSEEHTSALQSLMRTSYAVFCLKKNRIQKR